MTNEELLLAISDMMDSKLEQKLNTVLDTKLAPFNTRLQSIETSLQGDVLPRLTTIESSLNGDVLPRLTTIESTLNNNISPRMKTMEILLENDISPRLQNIEACYLSTYRRYQTGVEQIDAIQRDVDVMKIIVRNHSEKLHNIS